MTQPNLPIAEPVRAAARLLGAEPTNIPGLWYVPGYPELTEGQLLQVAAQRNNDDR